MCRRLAAAALLTILVAQAAGRSLLQDGGNAKPASFAARKDTNSQGTVLPGTAVQQALQNQKTTQLQSTMTQIKPQGNLKRALKQVGHPCCLVLDLSSMY